MGGPQLRRVLVRLLFCFFCSSSLVFAARDEIFFSLSTHNSKLSLSLSLSKKCSLIGPKIDYAVGYQQVSIPLPSPQPIASALLTPLRGAGSKLLEKVGALAARKVRGAVGGGVGGGAATSTTAAVDGAQQG